jgi:2-oxoglutarate ferredoxin oxidoreductase subunit delta
MVKEEKIKDNMSQVTPGENESKKRKNFKPIIYKDWCKSCGICIAFCPKKVFECNHLGDPVVVNPEKCIGCLFCELRCPDFAVSVEEKSD